MISSKISRHINCVDLDARVLYETILFEIIEIPVKYIKRLKHNSGLITTCCVLCIMYAENNIADPYNFIAIHYSNDFGLIPSRRVFNPNFVYSFSVSVEKRMIQGFLCRHSFMWIQFQHSIQKVNVLPISPSSS